MRKLRVSIRLKILLVISAVLLLAMGTYLYLATSLFTRDKLAYVYDLNASLVETVSEQTSSNLGVLVKSLHLFAGEILGEELSEEQRSAATEELFARERDILRVEIYGSDQESQTAEPRDVFVNPTVLEELRLSEDDLEALRVDYPLPLEAMLAVPGEVHVQNSSLPPEAAIVTIAYSDKSGSVIMAADFRQDSLLRILGRSKVHETYLVDQHGRILTHPKAAAVIEHADVSKHPLVSEAMAAKVNQGVKEFQAADGGTFIGAFARVGLGRLSVLTQISKAEALRASRELIDKSLYFAGIILLAAFMVSVLFARYLTGPVRRLRAATEVVGKGDFNVNVPVKSRDEIGDLARSFNQMAATLKQTQSQLIQSEKMAAFGQLGAGITHEVKNPMTGIIGMAQVGKHSEDEDAKELFGLIEIEGLRCKEILVNFLKFARGETSDMEEHDLNLVVQEAVKVFGHSLGMSKVKVKLDLGENLPKVMANPNRLQQVLLNLAMNAKEVMPKGGKVNITTSRRDDGQAVITVADNGPGMPEDTAKKIFEPFFTTKPAGEGTGLGLAISFGIVRDHGGTISVDSELGTGATFTIVLPESGSALEA